MKTLRVAVIQMQCAPGQKETNLQQAVELVERALEKGAELVLLPELFNTGYMVVGQEADLAEPIPGPTTERLQRYAEEAGVLIAGAILRRAGSRIYDAGFLLRPRRKPKIYHKVHLWKGEEKRWSAGRRLLPPVAFRGWKIGLLICNDLRFPEAARTLVLQGANLLLYSSAFGHARLYSWENQTRARSMENGIFTAYANLCGEEAGIRFAGRSRIVDPWGTALVNLSDTPGLACADLQPHWIQEARQEVPQLEQLRPWIYKYLK